MYKVLKPFDFYQVGAVMSDAEVKDQQSRGNLADLIVNGFIQEAVAIEVQDQGLDGLSLTELKEMAKAQGIKGYSRMKRDTLLEKLQ